MLRTCSSCKQTDDHPRHVLGRIGGADENPILANFHMDCHALLGCPICIEQIKGADGMQGAPLQEYLIEKPPLTDEHVAELLAQPIENEEG